MINRQPSPKMSRSFFSLDVISLLPHTISTHCFQENRGIDDYQDHLEKHPEEYSINSIMGVFLLGRRHLSILVVSKDSRICRRMIAHRNETKRTPTQTYLSVPTAMRW